jgi:hypothetical protein
MSRKLLTLVLLALACLMLFSACSDDGVPNGMTSVTLEGEPFILYVPEDWSDNRSSGISSAHFGLNVIASAKYYPLEDANATLDGYVASYLEECTNTYPDFSFSRKDSKLGKDAPAARIEFDFSTAENATTKAIQYITVHGEDAIILSFYCNSKDFPEYAETFEKIRSEFVLAEKSVRNDSETDKKTPSGMKLASSDDHNYVFYAPTSWITDLSDEHSYTYFAESGKPNVSVTAYTPDEPITVDEYLELCDEDYKKNLSGYEFVERSERKVFELDAVSYTYKAVYGGSELRVMQTVFVYNDLLYSITYTAHADRFDAHLEDVEMMLGAFRFR